MSTLQEHIQTLSDTDAERILTVFSSHQPDYSDSDVSNELLAALGNEPDLTSDEQTNEGDLARSALLLLADDPQNKEILNALVTGPAPQQLDLGTVATISAVLFVLGTHVKVERDKEGKWSFKIEKKPTDTALLKNLMNKLMGLLNSD